MERQRGLTRAPTKMTLIKGDPASLKMNQGFLEDRALLATQTNLLIAEVAVVFAWGVSGDKNNASLPGLLISYLTLMDFEEKKRVQQVRGCVACPTKPRRRSQASRAPGQERWEACAAALEFDATEEERGRMLREASRSAGLLPATATCMPASAYERSRATLSQECGFGAAR